MSNETTNTELIELKEYAKDLGLEFRDNIGLPRLKEKVAEFEEKLVADKKKEREKAKKVASEKVKVVVEPRERDKGIDDQYFGCISMATGQHESIQIQFGKEVEISLAMFNHIKSLTFGKVKYRTEIDHEGLPKKVQYVERQTRFIVSKV